MLPALRIDEPATATNTVITSAVTNPPPAEIVEPLGPPLPSLIPEAQPIIVSAPVQLPPPPGLPDGTLRVTPQMLVDYFRPVSVGTNEMPVMVSPGTFVPPQMSSPVDAAIPKDPAK